MTYSSPPQECIDFVWARDKAMKIAVGTFLDHLRVPWTVETIEASI